MIRIRSYRWGWWWERYRADVEEWVVARGPHDRDHWEAVVWRSSAWSQDNAEKRALRAYRKHEAEKARDAASERITQVA